jgi:hypothetical protein
MTEYKSCIIGIEPNPTYAAAVHLGDQKYFVLGTMAKQWKEIQAYSWVNNQRAEILLRLRRCKQDFRAPQLCIFQIQSNEHQKKLEEVVGSVVDAEEQENIIPNCIQQRQADLPPNLDAGQLWLVNYESRPSAILVSPLGDGFFAPGQTPCWGFSSVDTWRKLIHD